MKFDWPARSLLMFFSLPVCIHLPSLSLYSSHPLFLSPLSSPPSALFVFTLAPSDSPFLSLLPLHPPPPCFPPAQLDKDDMVYMEAYDRLLEAWLTLVQDDEHFPRGCFVQSAVQVFNGYIQCHLAAPDGTRNLVSTRTRTHASMQTHTHLMTLRNVQMQRQQIK